ncbi:hypothetical protein M9H77_24248 [Catharanthus roseus]|uniref:Uncharacterized protein n=1 Tax=Catharanthus roseus TaxID=4058 RepID=A0ACC0AXC6_CATRO|nr:hypothetical protein M9H77_24248 [Catharanthus roseus]
MAYASGSDRSSRHGKGKWFTGSFMSVMSKIARSRNKRPKVAREVPALTQKRKKPAEGGPVDPELIPSYDGHVAGSIWRGQDRGSLKFRSRYMALISVDISVLFDNENKLLDIRLRLDVMTADEVRWVLYRMQEI